jgi:hypothetical protein
VLGLTTVFNQGEGGQAPATGHGGAIGIFAWSTIDTIDTQTSEEKPHVEIVEIKVDTKIAVILHRSHLFIDKIAVLRKQDLAIATAITVIKSNTFIAKTKIAVLVEVIPTLAHKMRAWRKVQHKDNREYWAKFGYCYCNKLDNVHAIGDCDALLPIMNDE